MSRKTIFVQGPFYKGDTYTSRFLQIEQGTNLLTALRENGYELRCCEGKNQCGRCRVCYTRNAPLPTMDERTLLLPSELREGWRFACRHNVEGNAQIRLLGTGDRQLDVVMPQDGAMLPASVYEKKSFVAVDIGTTTIAMQAYTLDAEAAVLTSYTCMNPQRAYGADVISRIAAAEDKETFEKMSAMLLKAIEQGVRSIADRLVHDPEYVVITGNTTMFYFALGMDPKVIGKAPFGPIDRSIHQLELDGIKAYLIPGFSAFVGGDLLAGEMYLENRYSDEYSLLVDLGTNGEVILKKGDKLYGTATAAGPAFEGTISAQLLGADLLGFAAGLLKEGIMDATGLLKEPYFSEGVTYAKTIVSQKDIRQLQTGKAAIRVGIDLLLEEAGLEPADIPYVYLAGGFGYYLDPESAIVTGIFPDEFDGHIYSIGNSSLAGGREIGKLLIDGESALRRLESRIRGMQENATILNLAEQPSFDERYVRNMIFRTM